MLLLLLLACAHPAPLPAPASPEAPERAARPDAPPEVEVLARVGLPGLAGLSCDDQGACQVLVSGQLHALDPLRLALSPGRAAPGAARLLPDGLLLGPCPQDPTQRCTWSEAAPEAASPVTAGDAAPGALSAAWNEAVARGWRSPFADRVPSPQGGTMVFLAHPSPQVMQTGGGARMMAVQAPPAPAAWLRALALHPSGKEAYVLAWPGDRLLAFDPAGLRPRWALPLQGAGQGLFIEADGRLLLLEDGGEAQTERLLDWPARLPAPAEGQDPTGDRVLALAERPEARSTAVVDLAIPRLIWREDGRYLALLPLPGGDRLLATDQGLVRLHAPPLPSE